jgi:hypothetical protein
LGATLSVNYNTNVLDSRLQDVADAIDAGVSNGFLRLIGGGVVLSSFQLSRPCGVVASGVLAFSGLSLIDPAASATGVSTGARIEDSAGTVVISGLVVNGPSSSTDIFMTPGSGITAGQTVAITAATITGN